MIRRPPRSTRTDTLFPYTTLFRSALAARGHPARRPLVQQARPVRQARLRGARRFHRVSPGGRPARGIGAGTRLLTRRPSKIARAEPPPPTAAVLRRPPRPEARRVGKECVSTCRSGGSPYP